MEDDRRPRRRHRHAPALEVLIKGVFEPARFLDLVKNFVVFSDEPHGLVKRVAKYHQYWAVNAAVESTVVASGDDGDRRGGVVWHTQGSGKSIEMLLYAAKVMRDPRMGNPTLVFLTDRNDLDDQLFGEVFAPAEILPEKPVQADSRADLRTLLQRASGGIVFTTLQKFAPLVGDDTNPVLTDRRNVVVVADEAHRSQYGFAETLTADGTLKAGLAKHMRDALPGATFLGFTGTPIESGDKSTRSVFGDYIDVYDLTRAVEDGATVKIYYESRLAKVALSDSDMGALDELAEEITSEVDEDEASKAKSKWARLEAVVGAEDRLDLIANDIVTHWEKRREAMLGKAMIVTMSRRIAVRLYEKIVALRPDWHSDDPAAGKIKVVMTGSAADPAAFQPHIHSKDVRRDLKARAKDPNDAARAGDRARHVADRLRRALHAHHVRRQDHAGCRADAGHRPGEPHLPRQARWSGRRLHRRLRQPPEGTHRILALGPRPGWRTDRGTRRRDAGEARRRTRPAARL
ncbi:MAG: HsdR family type I site-specific deoxyribonuclease [Nocardioides sp.]